MALLEITTSNIPPALPPIGLIFKLNPLPDNVTPFLVPVLDNPNFNIPKANPPGIKQIVSGDLGITEQIYSPILDPTVSALATPVNTVPVVPANAGGTGEKLPTGSLGIKAPSTTTPLPKVNNPAVPIGDATTDVSAKFNFPTAGQSLNNAQKQFVNNAIPQDAGMKSFEKMTIQSMLESQKPTLELIQILIGMLGVIEDCIARFLGTSIKIPIINLWVGVPSKNPTYTKGALNYNAPGAMNKSYIAKLNNQAIAQVNPSFPASKNYGGIPGDDVTDYPEIQDDQLAYYIGYFDEDGAQILPPNWVLNSNKWFGKTYSIPTQVQQVEQLSSDLDQGVVQLRTRYANQLDQLQAERQNMVKTYYQQYALAESDAARLTVSNDKQYALAQYDEIQKSATDGIDQQIYSEWFTKNATAQIKNMYQQHFISTVTPVTDDKGNAIYPFTQSPTIHLAPGVDVEVPVVEAENQLAKKTITVDGKPKTVDTVVLEPNTSAIRIVKPNLDLGADVNYFSHKKPNQNLFVQNPTVDNIKKYYVPLNIKKYFLDWDYDIVFDYEIRSIKTGQVLRTEEDKVPARIQFEKDYQLRLIRIVNQPLSGSSNGKPVVNDSFFIGTNVVTTVVAGKSVSVSSKYFKSSTEVNLGQTDAKTGTALNVGNNIPPNYVQNTLNNTYSPDVLDLNNGLLEGEVFHGLDPRYVDAKKWKTFWLVEAIKKDANDDVYINGTRMSSPSDEQNKHTTGSGGKQWYGLLDKFTVIPRLMGGLLPLITRKFLPLLVKIIQILTNPSKIIELVNLIVQDKLNKFFKMFNNGATADANSLAAQKGSVGGAAGKFNYKDKSGKISNVLDGKASAKILIADVGLKSENGQVKIATPSDIKNSKVKDQPILKFILNLIKMPFDIMKKIIDFFIGFVKKLLNPFTLLQAMIDFVTFKWLIDILNPKRVTSVLGTVDPRLTAPDTSLESDLQKNLNSIDADTLFTETQASLRGAGITGLVEVFVYHIFKNGVFVKEEIEKHPITDPNLAAQTAATPTGFDNADVSGIDQNKANLTGANGDAEHPPQKVPSICGNRTIDFNKMLPLPFFSNMPKFNKCESIQVFLKPFQNVVGILSLIEQFINALISIPLSMLGLEPHITFPKLNFASKLQSFLNGLQAKMTQHTIPPIKPLTVPPNVKNLTAQQTFI